MVFGRSGGVRGIAWTIRIDCLELWQDLVLRGMGEVDFHVFWQYWKLTSSPNTSKLVLGPPGWFSDCFESQGTISGAIQPINFPKKDTNKQHIFRETGKHQQLVSFRCLLYLPFFEPHGARNIFLEIVIHICFYYYSQGCAQSAGQPPGHGCALIPLNFVESGHLKHTNVAKSRTDRIIKVVKLSNLILNRAFHKVCQKTNCFIIYCHYIQIQQVLVPIANANVDSYRSGWLHILFLFFEEKLTP